MLSHRTQTFHRRRRSPPPPPPPPRIIASMEIPSFTHPAAASDKTAFLATSIGQNPPRSMFAGGFKLPEIKVNEPVSCIPAVTTAATSSTTTTATRRSSIIMTAVISLCQEAILTKPATAFDFRMTVPDQTVDEAESGIQPHAQSLLRVKDLLMAESWKEAQKLLRKSSALLKQDIYTIIQAKPSDERPRLRKIYADLFNAVTKLDYAARDKDVTAVWECYNGIVLSLDDILSRL